MNKIDRSNYEEFLIDFMEGQLSAEVEQEVMLFLEANPDIAEEFDGLEEMTIPKIEDSFSQKCRLKHAELPTSELISYQNYEEYFVRSIDQDLSRKEQKELLLFLQLHPELSKEFELFQKTVSVADHKIEFPDPIKLKDIIIQPHSFINATNYEEIFVDYHEGNLSADQKKDVEAFVALYPHTQASFDTLSKVYFAADESIVYPNKAELKQKVAARVIPMYRMQRIAVAATIAFVFFFSWMYLDQDNGALEHKGIAKRSNVEHDWRKINKVTSPTSTNITKASEEIFVMPEPNPSRVNGQVTDEPEVQIASVRPAPMTLPTLEAQSIDELPNEDIALNIDYFYFAPIGQGIEDRDNLWKYATAYVGSYKPYLNGFKENIANQFNSDDVEYQGIDLWDVAKIGVMSFNELTENEYRLARRDK